MAGRSGHQAANLSAIRQLWQLCERLYGGRLSRTSMAAREGKGALGYALPLISSAAIVAANDAHMKCIVLWGAGCRP